MTSVAYRLRRKASPRDSTVDGRAGLYIPPHCRGTRTNTNSRPLVSPSHPWCILPVFRHVLPPSSVHFLWWFPPSPVRLRGWFPTLIICGSWWIRRQRRVGGVGLDKKPYAGSRMSARREIVEGWRRRRRCQRRVKGFRDRSGAQEDRDVGSFDVVEEEEGDNEVAQEGDGVKRRGEAVEARLPNAQLGAKASLWWMVLPHAGYPVASVFERGSGGLEGVEGGEREGGTGCIE
ncbi:hypothetical protein DFP72DRAFT_1040385 [Ephemerocybe angulata]|uniref:Uncharacterized protein n=1 Tax=Ephemerocybe angulata TaxID=980116 RepID=A0A8H6IDI3_9AGAR|nr:hypothetical protein DFP72DRAFT_1040385 [Tulosesus angulatus]